MSKFAKKVLSWCRAGYWTAEMVADAKNKGKITAEEYAEIIGD